MQYRLPTDIWGKYAALAVGAYWRVFRQPANNTAPDQLHPVALGLHIRGT
jgi:hypothetical protein